MSLNPNTINLIVAPVTFAPAGKLVRLRLPQNSGLLKMFIYCCVMVYFIALEHQTTQELAVHGERLSSLHAKLHLEADKIRKWKNQTEFDIKQKVLAV